MKHVLLVDDRWAMQIGLRDLLVIESPDLGMAIETGRWDAAAVDISLPGRSGLELVPVRKAHRPFLKVLIDRMYPEIRYGLRAMRSGADGYLTKDSPPEELFASIRQLLKGQWHFDETPAGQFVKAGPAEAHDGVSNREFGVFRRIARGQRLAAIATLNMNANTVGPLRWRMLEKLTMKTNADLVRYADRRKLCED